MCAVYTNNIPLSVNDMSTDSSLFIEILFSKFQNLMIWKGGAKSVETGIIPVAHFIKDFI